MRGLITNPPAALGKGAAKIMDAGLGVVAAVRVSSKAIRLPADPMRVLGMGVMRNVAWGACLFLVPSAFATSKPAVMGPLQFIREKVVSIDDKSITLENSKGKKRTLPLSSSLMVYMTVDTRKGLEDITPGSHVIVEIEKAGGKSEVDRIFIKAQAVSLNNKPSK